MGLFNLLLAELYCPHCKVRSEMEIEMRFGNTAEMRSVRLGDLCPWTAGKSVQWGGRPVQGDLDGEGYTVCPACNLDFFLVVQVREGRFTAVDVDLRRPGYLDTPLPEPVQQTPPEPEQKAWAFRPGEITENPAWVLDEQGRAILAQLAGLGVDIYSSLRSDNFVLLMPHQITPAAKEQVDALMRRFALAVCGRLEFADSYPHGEKHRIEPNFFAAARRNMLYGLQLQDQADTGHGIVLSFDLEQVLEALGAPARAATWRCQNVECTGPGAETLHAWSDAGECIRGDQLVQAAAQVQQTIEGDFLGTQADGQAWVMISAVDSSFFDLWTNDRAVAAQVRQRFERVDEIKE